jgi:hypothetical protein
MWISARAVARTLGISIHAVPRVAAANGIRRKVVPGTWTRFNKEDVDRVAAAAIVDEQPAPRRAEEVPA